MENDNNSYLPFYENELNSNIDEEPGALLENARDVSSRYQSTSEISCWGLMDSEFEEVKFELWGK